MPAYNQVIEGIKRLLRAHKTRHEDAGADEISLAGLTVASEDISFTSAEVVTATTLTADHYLVKVDASSGTITITLPAITSHPDREYTIIKTDSSGNKVKIVGTINGEEDIDLTLQYQHVIIHADDDGDEWLIVGGRNVKLEELLERKFTEQIDLLEKIRQEAVKATLHLASQSDENIRENDAQ